MPRAGTLGAHGQVRRAPPPPGRGPARALAHAAAAAAVLDGRSSNLRRSRAGLSRRDRYHSGRIGVSRRRTLADSGCGSWPRKPSGRGLAGDPSGQALTRRTELGARCRREKPGTWRATPGAPRGPRRGWRSSAAAGATIPSHPRPRTVQTLGSFFSRRPKGALCSPSAGRGAGALRSDPHPAHTHSPQLRSRFTVAAGSRTGSEECESVAPHSKRMSPRAGRRRAALGWLLPPSCCPLPAEDHPGQSGLRPGDDSAWSLFTPRNCVSFALLVFHLGSLLPVLTLLTSKHTRIHLFCFSILHANSYYPARISPLTCPLGVELPYLHPLI